MKKYSQLKMLLILGLNSKILALFKGNFWTFPPFFTIFPCRAILHPMVPPTYPWDRRSSLLYMDRHTQSDRLTILFIRFKMIVHFYIHLLLFIFKLSSKSNHISHVPTSSSSFTFLH